MSKNLTQYPQHIAASKTLAQLNQALDAARTEEARLQSALAKAPGKQPADPLADALTLMTGKESGRTDNAGLTQALDAVRGRIATLAAGAEQQRADIALMVNEISAGVCKVAAPSHAKAVQAIADALEGTTHRIAGRSRPEGWNRGQWLPLHAGCLPATGIQL